jgi:integrase
MIASRTRKDGRKVYDVRLRTPDGRTYTRTFPTQREAKAFEVSERADRDRGRWLDPRRADAPFSDAVGLWMEASAHKRPGSVARDRSIVKHQILPALGARPLGAISPAEIQRVVNAWVVTAAPATVVRQYATLRAILNHAVTTDLISRSPCRGIRVPSAQPREAAIVTAGDLEALAGHMPGLEAMPYLGGVMGLRWAEIAGLRVGSLDFLRLTVTIDRQWTRGAGGAMVSQPPKSLAGRRSLTSPGWLMGMLTQHLITRSLTVTEPEACVFTGPDGSPLQYSNWRQRIWLPATVAAGLKGLRFHDLRHTAGTALVTEGVDIKTAQVRLGHASPLTTLRVYAQATPSADQDAARRLGARFQPAGRQSVRATRDERAMEDEQSQGPGLATPPDQGASGGARWNRTTDLSIISAAL